MSLDINQLASENRIEYLEDVFWEQYAKHNEDEAGLERFLEERSDFINLLTDDAKI